MGANIPLPALDLRPQQPQENPVDQYMRLKAFQNQQQMQQQQIQAGGQENQMRQMQLQDMQTIQKIAPQYVTKDSSGKPTGYDYDGLTNGAIAAGVRPQSLAQLQTMRMNAAKTLLDQSSADKNLIQNQTDINKQAFEKLEGIRGISDPMQRQAQYASALQWAQQNKVDVSKFPQAVPNNDALTGIEASLGMHAQALSDAAEQAKARESNATAGAKEQESAFYKNNPTLGAPGVPAETVSMADYARQTGGSPAGFPAWKAKQEAIATQPQKLQLAAEEGKVRQLIQGMAEPVYAMDASGQKVLMNKTAALQAGSKVILPVNEKTVGDDIMLNNRLGDIRQKVVQYQQAMTQPLSETDKGNLAALLGTKGIKLGAFGTELPMERVNAALQSENLKNLSPQGRQALVAYRNVREAMLGYQRVLSGSARSSDRMFEVNEQTMPDPSISDPAFSMQAINAFRQNLQVVGQGLPKIPGVKSPDEIEQQVSQPQTQPKDFFSQFGGKAR